LAEGTPDMNAREARWLAVACVLLGTFVVVAPAAAVLLAIGLFAASGMFLLPKMSVAAVGVFLVVQPVLIAVVGGRETAVGNALQRLDEVILVVGILRIALLLPVRRVADARLWLILTGAFLFTGFASGILRGVPLATATLGAFLAVKFPLFLMLGMTIAWTPSDARQIVRAAFALPPVLLVTATLLWLAPVELHGLFVDPAAAIEDGFSRGGVRAMTAPFSHPGQLGWAMAVGACYVVAAFTAGLLSAGRASFSMVAAIVGILASLRRKPLVALPLTIVIGFVHGLKRTQRLYALGATMVLLAAAAVIARPRIEALIVDTAANYLDPYNPTAARTILYVTGWEIGARYFPLGAGFGRYGGYVSQIRYSPLYDEYGLSGTYGLSADAPYYIQDTYWPHILGETGWLGLVILASLLVVVWQRVMQVWEQHADPWARALGFGAAMALVEVTIESAAAPVFEGTLFAFVTALPLAAALVLGERHGLSRS
jgi:hypothetical protein